MRRMYTPATYTVPNHQNIHGYIFIQQSLNEWKCILNKRFKQNLKLYLIIKNYIGNYINIHTEINNTFNTLG